MYNNYPIFRRPAASLARRGKVRCPECGRKTFVNYVYPDGSPVADGVCGKCDRADHCGTHVPPRIYYAEHPDERRLPDCHPLRPCRPPSRPRAAVVAAAPAPARLPGSIPLECVDASLRHYGSNPLVRFLHKTFDSVVGADCVDDTVGRYLVGTSKQYGGSTVFWQIDGDGRVRTGQVMAYDPGTGRRIHGRQNWAHSLLGYGDSEAFGLRQCYFGHHLLAEAHKTLARMKSEGTVDDGSDGARPVVFLFESPKAALIMDIVLRGYGFPANIVCMATCGCGNFNPKPGDFDDPFDKVGVLRDVDVAVYPDKGKASEWAARARGLAGFSRCVAVSTYVEKMPDDPLFDFMMPFSVSDGEALDDMVVRFALAGCPVDTLVRCALPEKSEYVVCDYKPLGDGRQAGRRPSPPLCSAKKAVGPV